jgi:hypothetical protein
MDIHASGFYPGELPGIQSGPRCQIAQTKISFFTHDSKELPKLA